MHPVHAVLVIVISSLAVATARAQGKTAPAADVVLDTVQFAPELGVDLTSGARVEPGLYYRDLTPGAGRAARRGNRLTVRYAGWLAGGQPITSPDEATRPFTFKLGAGDVLPGWEQALAGLQVGGHRQLVLGPAFGYGARRIGPVPENSVLVFEIELVAIR